MMIFKKFWENRNEQEKKYLLVGFCVIIFGVMYYWIWQPFHNNLRQLKSDNQYQEEILEFLKDNKAMLLKLRGSARESNNTRPLFILIEESMKSIDSKIKPVISRISDSEVSVEYSSVDFNEFMQATLLLSQRYGIEPVRFQAIRKDKAGFADVKVVFSN